jgi:hypothetical protein
MLLQLGKSNSYEGQSEAYKYLANYYLKHEQLDAAYQAAQICSEYTEVRKCLHNQLCREKRGFAASYLGVGNDVTIHQGFFCDQEHYIYLTFPKYKLTKFIVCVQVFSLLTFIMVNAEWLRSLTEITTPLKCRFKSHHALWILLYDKAIQLSYGRLVILHRC